jgi:hypothetical protein
MRKWDGEREKEKEKETKREREREKLNSIPFADNSVVLGNLEYELQEEQDEQRVESWRVPSQQNHKNCYSKNFQFFKI